MRPLGAILEQAGWMLTGSDAQQASVPTAASGECGPGKFEDVELVIASHAIADDHPELLAARAAGCEILKYPQALGRISGERRTLAIAGTHGKSTTTAMLSAILAAAELDPTIVYGAEPIDSRHASRLGMGPWFAVEACEYRHSLLELPAEAAVILNIEHDHFDCFPDFESLVATFSTFASRLPRDGALLIPSQCPVARRVAAHTRASVETFGVDVDAGWRASGLRSRAGRYRFEMRHGGQRLGRIDLQVPGRHNVQNALAASALAARAGCPWPAIQTGLARFSGLRRRLETLRDDAELTIVDDYAHHPTEIAASLAAIRELTRGRRLWCVFQPHQISRTAWLLETLADSLRNADKLIVAEIFRAREPEPMPGDVTAFDLAQCVAAQGGDVAQVYDLASITEHLRRQLSPGDVLVTMGAGDIGKIAYGLGKWFRENSAAR